MTNPPPGIVNNGTRAIRILVYVPVRNLFPRLAITQRVLRISVPACEGAFDLRNDDSGYPSNRRKLAGTGEFQVQAAICLRQRDVRTVRVVIPILVFVLYPECAI